MKKMNNKGYMLVEIILAFVVTFILIYFLMDLVIKMKNKNDDLLVGSLGQVDQAIITNKLMEYIVADPEGFDCNIKVNGQNISYNGENIAIVDDSVVVGTKSCSNSDGKVSVKIPLTVKQMPDENFDVLINYRYGAEGCLINDGHSKMLDSYSCSNTSYGEEPYKFTYSGECSVHDDGDGNWRIKFLTSGTFIPNIDVDIDAFLVGGGGGGGASGGGGGYTTIEIGIPIESSVGGYEIVVGEGGPAGTDGEDTTGFGLIANGGGGAESSSGGDGGSGGGFGVTYDNPGVGGSDGSDGLMIGSGGKGQGVTTREFGEPDGTLYSGGGAGAYGSPGNGGGGTKDGGDGEENTGGGGGVKSELGSGGSGGSGIVVIRNSRKRNLCLDFEYDGVYTIIDDGSGNWRIRFLTGGTFTSYMDMTVDAFLVGGGGGGGIYGNGCCSGGGGGGGYTTTTLVNIKKNVPYDIVIGTGGEAGTDGDDTTAFNAIAFGGEAANGNNDRTGGSGGNGGSNGTDGFGGASQRENTYEFGDEISILYSTGGGNGTIRNAAANTGDGGTGDGTAGGTGGSGIVVIRNSSSQGVNVDFTYENGYYAIEHEGGENWKIKFLTNGTFKSYIDMTVDAFLVGGGGGGGYAYEGGGGGGGYTTTALVNIEKNVLYDIVIGDGGEAGNDGDDTSGFNLTALGGKTGNGSSGGNGGNGGKAGIDGNNGASQSGNTYEFGDETSILYSIGGVGGIRRNAAANTGDGGGGSPEGGGTEKGGNGGSGIVIIRIAE